MHAHINNLNPPSAYSVPVRLLALPLCGEIQLLHIPFERNNKSISQQILIAVFKGKVTMVLASQNIGTFKAAVLVQVY